MLRGSSVGKDWPGGGDIENFCSKSEKKGGKQRIALDKIFRLWYNVFTVLRSCDDKIIFLSMNVWDNGTGGVFCSCSGFVFRTVTALPHFPYLRCYGLCC
jgi:hypothetical protein